MEILIPVAGFIFTLAGVVLLLWPMLAPSAPGSHFEAWPSVTVIVPVTGASPHLAESIRSLLSQDYPTRQFVFVISEEPDPAWPIVQTAIASSPAAGVARIVASGLASNEAQKNHMLRFAVATLASDPDVLVFADAGRLAPESWLRNLVLPVASASADVASSYYRITMARWTLAGRARAVVVELLAHLRQVPLLTQPWGGSTAIRATTFRKLRVVDAWQGQVVDDVTLTRVLQQVRIPVTPVRVFMEAPLEGETWSSYTHWLTRQIQYLRYVFPCEWLAGTALAWIWVITLVANLMLAARWLAGQGPLLPGILAIAALLVFFALLTVASGWRGSPLPWALAAVAASLGGAWCFVLGGLKSTVEWRGITYRVGSGGRVTAIVDRPATTPPPAEDRAECPAHPPGSGV